MLEEAEASPPRRNESCTNTGYSDERRCEDQLCVTYLPYHSDIDNNGPRGDLSTVQQARHAERKERTALWRSGRTCKYRV